jgi:predicted  nucleic acid-binding Zn-ribbon protein
MEDSRAKLASLEREKEAMIRQYLSLQDEADAVNEKIYRVCCSVEALNLQILLLKEEIRKAELKSAPPAAPPPLNGKAHP